MIDLSTLTLTAGSHATRADGLCLLEAAAWWAGEDHSDHPACVSPVLASYGRRLNDALPGTARQQLVPLVPLMPGTAGDGRDVVRGYLALDWLVRTYTPAWLELAGLTEHAAGLRALAPVADLDSARTTGPAVREASRAASATWAAARAATWAATWAAAGDAAWAAAWAAAGDAAREAARDAAREAARDVLTPTVSALQTSAVRLLHTMATPPAAE
ncbi:hypothetical protein ACIQGZ_17395 [Streptomyces sp. NPDC092296]|uniref:hypothetical protein n=1 Tax=Streptomyces sp. NPDC092296 TaxID=3366012 RepID=UPI00382DACB7